jgi:hypothetical protein
MGVRGKQRNREERGEARKSYAHEGLLVFDGDPPILTVAALEHKAVALG